MKNQPKKTEQKLIEMQETKKKLENSLGLMKTQLEKLTSQAESLKYIKQNINFLATEKLATSKKPF